MKAVNLIRIEHESFRKNYKEFVNREKSKPLPEEYLRKWINELEKGLLPHPYNFIRWDTTPIEDILKFCKHHDGKKTSCHECPQEYTRARLDAFVRRKPMRKLIFNLMLAKDLKEILKIEYKNEKRYYQGKYEVSLIGKTKNGKYGHVEWLEDGEVPPKLLFRTERKKGDRDLVPTTLLWKRRRD
nr:MAG: hypothetical protein [Lokiarchaeota virus Skoll Meg22_1214]